MKVSIKSSIDTFFCEYFPFGLQGQVKVVRYQTVVDAKASNECRFTSPRVDDLGMGKSFSHANSRSTLQVTQWCRA